MRCDNPKGSGHEEKVKHCDFQRRKLSVIPKHSPSLRKFRAPKLTGFCGEWQSGTASLFQSGPPSRGEIPARLARSVLLSICASRTCLRLFLSIAKFSHFSAGVSRPKV